MFTNCKIFYTREKRTKGTTDMKFSGKKVAGIIVGCVAVLVIAVGIALVAIKAKDAKLMEEKNYDAVSIKTIMKSERPLTWVFAGDSITHNSKFTMGMNGYVEWFEKYLYDEEERLDDAVINTAWGGADIRDFLVKEDTPSGQGTKYDAGQGVYNFVTKYNPDVIFIKIGMNNRDMTSSAFQLHYKQMLDSIYKICKEEYGKIPKIILLSTTPRAGENTLEASPASETLDRRNDVAAMAEEYDLLFCDLRTAFIEEGEILGSEYMSTFFSDSSDGVTHPNSAGQYYMFKTLAKEMGIYDEKLPVFQVEYQDINEASLYLEDTYEITYDNGYGSKESQKEMDKIMPSLDAVQVPKVLASIDFNADNGAFNGKEYYGDATRVSLTDEEICQNPLTLEEAKGIKKEFSVVFRAKLNLPTSSYQTVLFMSPKESMYNWNNAVAMGVPGQRNWLFYGVNKYENLLPARDSGVFQMGGNSLAGDNKWHTIALTQSNTGFTYYVDGQVVYQDDTTLKDDIGTYFNGSQGVVAHIGSNAKDNASNYNLSGSMDYYVIYDGALSADQVGIFASANPATQETGISWADLFVENNVWLIAGAEQMTGYNGPVVNRSLFRIIENGVRFPEGFRDLRFVNAGAPGYTVEKLNAEYDKIIGKHEHQVFLLLPEVSQVYEADYKHSAKAVEAYQKTVEELLEKEADKVRVLWTPLASGDKTINGYIGDYAEAIRNIAEKDGNILMFDANQFMNENAESNPFLMRNWYDNGAYITPLAATDVARAFFGVASQGGAIALDEVTEHSLRYMSDMRRKKSKVIWELYEANSVKIEGKQVTVDLTDIKNAYDLKTITFAVMPGVGTGNNHKDISYIDEAEIKVSDNKYTFEVPSEDAVIAIYGETGTKTYRFKDIIVE